MNACGAAVSDDIATILVTPRRETIWGNPLFDDWCGLCGGILGSGRVFQCSRFWSFITSKRNLRFTAWRCMNTSWWATCDYISTVLVSTTSVTIGTRFAIACTESNSFRFACCVGRSNNFLLLIKLPDRFWAKTYWWVPTWCCVYSCRRAPGDDVAAVLVWAVGIFVWALHWFGSRWVPESPPNRWLLMRHVLKVWFVVFFLTFLVCVCVLLIC